MLFDIYLGAYQPQPEFGGQWLNIWNPLTSTSHMPTYKQIQNSFLLPKHALVSPSFYLHLVLSSFNHIVQVQLILLWSYLSKNLKIYVSDLNESNRIQRISLVTVIPNQPCNKPTSECHVIQFFTPLSELVPPTFHMVFLIGLLQVWSLLEKFYPGSEISVYPVVIHPDFMTSSK